MNSSLTTRRTAMLIAVAVMFNPNASLAQYPTSCASVGSKANSNGQATSCPNAGGAMATNFNSTSYATVPASSKTGNLQLSYAGANASLTPYAITKVWLTTTGSTIQTVAFGPASPPTVSGGNTLVDYCFYGANLPTLGTLSFQMTNPQTGVVWGICSYDASCNSNCAVTSNPTTLPVIFTYFKVLETNGATVKLGWQTAQEQHNKGFGIQRSIKDSSYATIGFVPSAHADGNSSTSTVYTFVDNNVSGAGEIYYRIRQMDLDGQYYYSAVALASFTGKPASPAIYSSGREIIISFSAAGLPPDYEALVYDTQGRLVRRMHVPAAGKTSIAGLPAGNLYHVSLRDARGSQKAIRSVYID